uniref:Uncharacterized protein n=1 Tax=Callorhinchus milii TaxID=7868 RepID=A0A4W3HAE1_CALMI
VGPQRPLVPGGREVAGQGVLADQLAPRAAVHAQLQRPVLVGRAEGLFGHADGEGQVLAHLPHDDGGPDVTGLDLHLGAPRLLQDPQAALPVPLAAVLRAVHKGRGQVARHRLVHLLLRAAAETLEYDRHLRGGGGGKKDNPQFLTFCSQQSLIYLYRIRI